MKAGIASSLPLLVIATASLADANHCEATYNAVSGELSLPCLDLIDTEGGASSIQVKLQQTQSSGPAFELRRLVEQRQCAAELTADSRLTIPCLTLNAEPTAQQRYAAQAEVAVRPDGLVELYGVELQPARGGSEFQRMQKLGRSLFFDTNLSEPAGQSCASCHDPEHAFTDPDTEFATSEGAIPGRFGIRNTPSAAYAAFSPPFYFDPSEGLYIGGQFLDGRGATLEEQAKGPFLNELEMANPNRATVVEKVSNAEYASEFLAVFGDDAFADVDLAYDDIAKAIASFERSPEVNPFSSKFDAYLAGNAELTAQELLGRQLFESETKGNCAACHPSAPLAGGTPPLFTDFTYDNLGVPKAPENPFYNLEDRFNPYGTGFLDLGLGAQANAAPPSQNHGKFKVPSLRNVARTPPYMHNGVFKTLREAVEFYNSRDTDPQRWGAPEVSANVNREELGDLGLSKAEIDAILAFLETLSDGYPPGT